MAYEYKGIKCDTYEELQRVMTMNNQSGGPPRPAPMSEDRGHCYNPNHRDDCRDGNHRALAKLIGVVQKTVIAGVTVYRLLIPANLKGYIER